MSEERSQERKEAPMTAEREPAMQDEQPKTKEREPAIEYEEPILVERPLPIGLAYWVDVALAVEKLRVSSQVRATHFQLRGKTDLQGEKLRDRLTAVEKYCDDTVASYLTAHPAWPWLCRVKGVGKENVAKIVGLVDINRAPTISSLWMFAGLAPQAGRTMTRVKGEKLRYNATLRTMCWRLGSSLLRARGSYYEYYLKAREDYEERFRREGKQILPTPHKEKAPGKRNEPEGTIYLGHLHAMALRKMVKLFLSHLWLIWRRAEGLPVSLPYPIAIQGHSHYVSPESMMEKEAESL